MGSTKTAEEIKNEMIEKLGTDFGSLFYSLYNEITWLTFKWIEFRELYGTKESRIELMNKVAPFFFYSVQKVLWDNLLLGIARITDPPETFGKKNITLKAITKYLNDEDFKVEYEQDLEKIITKSSFCRDWRNRWIAHLDYNLSTKQQNAIPLKKATRQNLKETVEMIQDLYNKISLRYFQSTTAFKYLQSDRGSVSLLYRIEDGLRFEEEEYKKKLNGEWRDDNFKSKV